MSCQKIQTDSLNRLKRIGGQVNGLGRMVEEERYCIDILMQITAVERALHSLGEIVLKNHLETCVAGAFQSTESQDSREKIDELIRVFAAMRPR